MLKLSEKRKRNIIFNSSLELGENQGEGKGRYFKSRFIEAGIAHYKELGDILITKETLDKFIQSLVGAPVIIDHEDVTNKNVEKLRAGTVSRVWFNSDDGWFWCEGILTDPQAVDLIKNHGWNVSCAYSFVADESKKQHNGKPIDMEFIDGNFLHLAIVEEPRYENANIVVNSRDGEIINEVENSITDKELNEMALLEELKKLIGKVENEAEEKEKETENKCKNEDTDKRKLIDEIGGILKGKVDDELIRTIIKKAEKIAYDKSEADTADNKCKNDDDETEKEKEEKEEKFEEEKEIASNKKQVKNSMDDVKRAAMGGNSYTEAPSLYTSRKERLELGNKY